jgi:AmiR/NasT family two-component response regulator
MQQDASCEGLTHIVAVTSFTNQTITDQCKDTGIMGVYNKPLHFKQLFQIVMLYFYKETEARCAQLYEKTFKKSL